VTHAVHHDPWVRTLFDEQCCVRVAKVVEPKASETCLLCSGLEHTPVEVGVPIIPSGRADKNSRCRVVFDASFGEVTDGVSALGEAFHVEKHDSAHVKGHLVDWEASTSYRIGHTIVLAAKAPKKLVDSVRARRA